MRDYLRKNISYNDQIDAPPDGVDPVHYTLFVTQEGYCNYYASAMAIMLRSQGVPSRVVSGYAQGEYDETSQSYRVRANNAHTWVEVYFPQYGWIQFEPTASLPLIDRPARRRWGCVCLSCAPTGVGKKIACRKRLILPDANSLEDLLGGEDAGQGRQIWERFSIWQALGAVIVCCWLRRRFM